jgi:hypothetical protein
MANCKPNAWRVPRTRRDVIEDAVLLGCTLAMILAVCASAWLMLTDSVP